jgi:hypothetical protein
MKGLGRHLHQDPLIFLSAITLGNRLNSSRQSEGKDVSSAAQTDSQKSFRKHRILAWTSASALIASCIVRTGRIPNQGCAFQAWTGNRQQPRAEGPETYERHPASPLRGFPSKSSPNTPALRILPPRILDSVRIARPPETPAAPVHLRPLRSAPQFHRHRRNRLPAALRATGDTLPATLSETIPPVVGTPLAEQSHHTAILPCGYPCLWQAEQTFARFRRSLRT